jgi:hypothetical protein
MSPNSSFGSSKGSIANRRTGELRLFKRSHDEAVVAGLPVHQLAHTQDVSWGERSGGDAEELVDELALADNIPLGQPTDLSLPDQMHRLVSFDRPPRVLRRTKAKTRHNALFDEAWSCSMMLFK